MNQEPTYRVPSFTTMELLSLRCALREDVCRFFKWRHNPTWRQTIRASIAAYRKLQRAEVAI
jgi:hypothetical protein